MKPITGLFAELLGGGRRLDTGVVKRVIDEMRSAMQERTEEGPEVIGAFNSVLKGFFSFGQYRVRFNGDESDAWHARCTAAVFLALAREQVLFNDSSSAYCVQWGWDSLNLDAKGWCVALLECDPPVSATPGLLRLLALAKDDIRTILRLTKRRGERILDRTPLINVSE